ncbi:MAG: CDP-alcohol phosphatidyltransferase family protein [Ruminococcaceae bacterium]|nr:CDP-alcohol phosphatidyltransferase family protein [Oscillospiraceae bacterium]
MIWLYCYEENYFMTLLVLVLSGITDVADGFIARKFNMVSDFGKAFDPVADKLTQIGVMFCLVKRFSFMKIPLVILVVKELFAGITGLITIRKTGKVMGAVWHGKLTTVLLYSMMALHIVWFNIPERISDISIFLCTIMMLTSAVLYGIRNIEMIRSN